MVFLSEQFYEQYAHVQQQYIEQWTPFEQFCASMELSKKLHSSYRYFLSQFLAHVNMPQENSEIFNHMIRQANTHGNLCVYFEPFESDERAHLSLGILVCLLSDPLDTIISTLQLYLPLLSLKNNNDKLIEAYRDVLLYLDSKLNTPSNFSYTEQQLIQFCQQIRYFIENNPTLQKYLNILPHLTVIASAASGVNTQIGHEEVGRTSVVTRYLIVTSCWSGIRTKTDF
jgi:hypothetical protein